VGPGCSAATGELERVRVSIIEMNLESSAMLLWLTARKR
jgi:hypothetical protein